MRKVWRQLQREGFAVARCSVERLMGEMALRCVIRGNTVRTTVSDKAAPCPLDHVNRQFHVPATNRLWLSDFRWFVGLGIDDAAWDQTTFGKNRDRLLEGQLPTPLRRPCAVVGCLNPWGHESG